jgi:uncharacterized protein YjbJ (UPF0337 family)
VIRDSTEGVPTHLASHESRITSLPPTSTDGNNDLPRAFFLYSLHLETIVNSNQDKGIGKQVKGTVKDVVGKVTGDRVLEGEGKIEKGVGKVQKKVGDAQQPPPPRNDRM